MNASPHPLPPPDAGPAARPPRAAATIVVARDATAGGIEVLLSRRADGSDYTSGAWVFPGGVVDRGDRAVHAGCAGLDDAEASRRLGLAEGGLDFWVAAIRECFEESGLLFATRDGADLGLDDLARLAPWRGALHRGERGLAELCDEERLCLAVDRVAYFAHWLTPLGRAKRFDTRFFVAAAPRAQTAAFDGTEMVEQLWLAPADALSRAGTLKLLTPTQKTLEALAGFADTAALMAWARAPRRIAVTMPWVATGRDGLRPVLPDEPAWAELSRIDPEGHGNGSYDIVADRPVRLSSRIVRVTADNGSVMTGPGTNAYLVGSADGREWAVIDPGPASEAHVEAIVAAAPGPITKILVTHTHTDHSPGCVRLKARTGAPLFGRAPAHREWQDPTFAADVPLAGGERIEVGAGTTLVAVHTPGHASNHLCYLLEEEKTLFTGDHVMQLSTVVINPPDGDMAAYLASLRDLAGLDVEWLAPGHGFLMKEPRKVIEAIVAHRLKREAKVVAALEALEAPREDELLARVYDDVPARLHPMALRSLRAHLLKLRDERQAVEDEGRWRRVV